MCVSAQLDSICFSVFRAFSHVCSLPFCVAENARTKRTVSAAREEEAASGGGEEASSAIVPPSASHPSTRTPPPPVLATPFSVSSTLNRSYSRRGEAPSWDAVEGTLATSDPGGKAAEKEEHSARRECASRQ